MTYNHRMTRFLPIVLCLAATACAASGHPARVVGVSDGDTITVLTAEKRQIKIRLAGIDAPESGQDFGARSKQLASELAFGKTVEIRPQSTDRYGRTVAEVVLPDGRSLNHEMVGRGMAWHYVRYAPKNDTLARLEASARKARLGLWGQPGAVPPWDWRAGKGASQKSGFVGNRRSLLYHAPNCRGVAAMKARNRIPFETEAQAEAAGYRRAGDCR